MLWYQFRVLLILSTNIFSKSISSVSTGRVDKMLVESGNMLVNIGEKLDKVVLKLIVVGKTWRKIVKSWYTN